MNELVTDPQLPSIPNPGPPSKSHWQTILAVGGGLSLFVGLYLSTGDMYDRFYPNEPYVVATATTYEFTELPPTVITEADAKKLVDDKIILAELPEDKEETQKKVVRDLLIETSAKAARDNRFTGTWTITVENRGKKKATDVRIKLPFDGRYLLVPSISPPNAPFKTTTVGTIDLGELHSSDLMRVVVWTDDHNTAYSPSKEYRVTYSEGPATSITFPQFVKKEGVDITTFVLGICAIIVGLFIMSAMAAASVLKKLKEASRGLDARQEKTLRELALTTEKLNAIGKDN